MSTTQLAPVSCDNCGHAVDQHDRVALRYCAASDGHDQRGCICPGQITTTAEAADAAEAAGAADATNATDATDAVESADADELAQGRAQAGG